MSSTVGLFLLGFIVWILLNWVPDWQHLVIGIFVSGLAALLTRHLFPKRFQNVFDPRRYFWALYYIPVFLVECVKANLDVAYRVIHPDLPIRPGIVRVKTQLKSDLGLTFLANTITLTPGTMSVDIDKESGILYIHWICVKEGDIENTTRRIVGRFEAILKRVFE